MAQAYDQFVEAGAQLWAISSQSRRKNIQFRRRREIQYPILEDVGHAVIRAWGLVDELDPHQSEIPYPTTYIIQEKGRVHWRRLGKTKDDRWFHLERGTIKSTPNSPISGHLSLFTLQ